jgi:hypothetical protein
MDGCKRVVYGATKKYTTSHKGGEMIPAILLLLAVAFAACVAARVREIRNEKAEEE